MVTTTIRPFSCRWTTALLLTGLGLFMVNSIQRHSWSRFSESEIEQGSRTNSGKYDLKKYAEKHSLTKFQTGSTGKKYMALVEKPGRSGNQLFQYAMLLSTAHRYSYIPLVPSGFPLSKILIIPEGNNLTMINAQEFGEKGMGIYNSAVESMDTKYNWTLNGWYQSWRYHDNDFLKSAIRFRPELLQSAKEFLNDVSKEGYPNICLHVRRGDFQTEYYSSRGYAMADETYIHKAMNYYREKLGNVLFIVLSNGMEWCKENIIGSDVTFSRFADPGRDMALMSLCDHMIVTTGTFGWWGGWLSGGEVVYYPGYPQDGTFLGNEVNKTDYYPPHWKAIE